MTRTYFNLLIVASVLAIFISGCKKDNSSTQVISLLTDTAGTNLLMVTYNSDNKPARIANSDATYDFYYSGDKLVKRTQTLNSVVTTDSFFYDGNGRFARVDNYGANNNKTRSTVFAYNADNTINAATINSEVFGTPDAMFEFTYSNGNLNTVKEYEKVLGTFSLKRQHEFLAFDGRHNPMQDIIRNYLPDQFNLLIFMFSSGNNFTSMKQTDYNLANGDITGTYPATATYTYNGDNLPAQITFTFNGNTTRATFHYTTL